MAFTNHILLLTILMTTWTTGLSQDVDQMCRNVHCVRNHICRVVVKTCNYPPCRPQFLCLPCVPEGIDEECNHKGFLYSVIRNDTSQEKFHESLECNMNMPCPSGSTCVQHRLFAARGVCCYGGPYPSRVYTNDKICVRCIPQCSAGSHCERIDTGCGEGRNQCVQDSPFVKPGYCPGPSNDCDKGSRPCDNDQDCPDVQKCCNSGCDSMTCQNPILG